MHSLRSSALAIMLSACSVAALSVAAQAQVSIDISVNVPPPPLPYYEQPPIPAEGYLWMPGYWAWDDSEGDFYWVPGTWVEAPQPDLLWTPGYWGWRDGRYVFYEGYWAPQVGFYGGVDYGYGYTGDGYQGGHWDHGAFFYNRRVNNIANVRITNVYNQTVVVNNRGDHVSFNGGDGGTKARPTPQQEAAAKERHVEATPIQRQHAEAARKDRALFSKENHGEPAVAATARPGVFEGAGVSHGSNKPVTAANPGAEQPANELNKETPKAEEPKRIEKEAPKAEEPKRIEKEAPKAEEPKRIEKEAPKAEEPKRIEKEAPKAEEPEADRKGGPQGRGAEADREGGPEGRGAEADREGGPQGRGAEANREGGPQGRGAEADREGGPQGRRAQADREGGPQGGGAQGRAEAKGRRREEALTERAVAAWGRCNETAIVGERLNDRRPRRARRAAGERFTFA